jgi:hypothetical protein
MATIDSLTEDSMMPSIGTTTTLNHALNVMHNIVRHSSVGVTQAVLLTSAVDAGISYEMATFALLCLCEKRTDIASQSGAGKTLFYWREIG